MLWRVSAYWSPGFPSPMTILSMARSPEHANQPRDDVRRGVPGWYRAAPRSGQDRRRACSRLRIARSSSRLAWSRPQRCRVPCVTRSRSSSAGDQRTSPVWPPRPWTACSTARSTEIAMSPMWIRGARWPAAARRVLRAGNASGGSIGNDSTSVGPSWPRCSWFSSASSASSVRTTVTPPGIGAPAASSAAPTARTRTVSGATRSVPARRTTSIRHGPTWWTRVASAGRRASAPPGAPGGRTAARCGAPRFELDDLVLRVGDPLVVHPEELLDEGLLDRLEVAQREVALVELAVLEALRDDAVDHAPDRRLVTRLQRSDGGLDAVGQHDEGRLAALRLRPGVAEATGIDGLGGSTPLLGRETPERRGGLFPGLRGEVAHDRGPVVLRDEGDDRLRQARPVGDIDPVRDVLLEDLGRRLGIELVVDVLAAGLVLDERGRVRQLADVVVVGRDAGDQRIGADRLGRALGQVPDHQRVVVRARRLDEQPPEQGLGRVCQLEQLEHREQPEDVPEDGEAADGHHGRQARRDGRRADELDDAGDVPLAEERERGH